MGLRPLFFGTSMISHDHPFVAVGGVFSGTTPASKRIIAAVQQVVEPLVASLGLVLVEVQTRGHGPKTLIRVVIERPPDQNDGALSVEDCGSAHLVIGHALDVADPIPHAFLLEVSSPGLDRPIRYVHEFERFAGRLARFKLANPKSGQIVVIGRIQQWDGSHVWVESAPQGQQKRPATLVALPLAEILEARLEVEL